MEQRIHHLAVTISGRGHAQRLSKIPLRLPHIPIGQRHPPQLVQSHNPPPTQRVERLVQGEAFRVEMFGALITAVRPRNIPQIVQRPRLPMHIPHLPRDVQTLAVMGFGRVILLQQISHIPHTIQANRHLSRMAILAQDGQTLPIISAGFLILPQRARHLSQMVQRVGRPLGLAQGAVQSQTALGVLPCLLIIAPLIGQIAQIVERAGHPALVANLLANGQTLLEQCFLLAIGVGRTNLAQMGDKAHVATGNAP